MDRVMCQEFGKQTNEQTGGKNCLIDYLLVRRPPHHNQEQVNQWLGTGEPVDNREPRAETEVLKVTTGLTVGHVTPTLPVGDWSVCCFVKAHLASF
jgi:hypothetical protein